MMNESVSLAKYLLQSDGTFFSSIDHNELSTLKPCMDSLFSGNLEGLISWRRCHNQPNDRTKMIGLVSEYILVYAKDAIALKKTGVGKIDLTGKFSNPDADSRGDWSSKPWKVGVGQSGTRYTIVTPNGENLDEEWMGDETTYQNLFRDNRIVFTKNGCGLPRKKYFKFEREKEGQCVTNWWEHSYFGHNAGTTSALFNLFGNQNTFNNPKPTELIRGIVQTSGYDVNIVMDYFAGSGTTGHAVINLNREDDGVRKYILVEIGHHFESVLLPRIKKVIYSKDWKEGKPIDRNGIS